MSYQFTAPGEARSWEKIRTLAKECVKASQGERPEVRRLKNIYEELRKAKGLSRAGMDALIYQRIYGKEPERTSSTLKIRYWRTGHHVPVNRDTALAFARALELPSRDTSWFLTAWLDKSLEFYPEAPPRQDLLYWQRRRRLEDLASGYLERMFERPPSHLNGIRLLEGGPLSNLRHLYYVDALQYICQEPSSSFWEKHIYSIRYDMELKRSLKLLGEIPRRTMIRHLIILGLPDLSAAWMNEQLAFFGYLPLSPEHTLTGGEYLDRLLLGILSAYEDLKQKNGPDCARLWFLNCYRKLDAYFVRNKKNGFRFMYFKSLE